MRYLRHIITFSALAAVLLTSCVRENLRAVDPDGRPEQDGDHVTLDLSIRMMAEAGQGVWTKSFGEEPEVKDLYVAVFDGGDILTEIVKAEPGTVDDPRDVFQAGTPASDYLTRYHVTLKRTSESREVQFIAIGEKDFIDVDAFDMIDEASFIKKFIVTEGVDAYWCRKHFEGINEESARFMQGLKMIRNFLKVSVSLSNDIENFEFSGFKVFNKPRYGTLAPYNPSTPEYKIDNDVTSVNFDRFADYSKVEGNEEDDDNKAYKELVETQHYTGYMPSTVEYISMREEIGGENPDDWFDDHMITSGGFDYLYECTYTDVANPFIIFKGRYTGPGASGQETYYKADFVYHKDENSDKIYFHLLRNFFYELKIASVANDGAATLEAAVNSPSMNNFDGSSESHTYTVISKTGARMYISSTDILVTDGIQTKVYLKNLTGENFDVNEPDSIRISKITKCINVKDVNQSERLTPLISYNPDDASYAAAIQALDFDPENGAYINSYDIVRTSSNATYNGSSGWVEYTINLAKNPNTLGDNEMWQQEITFSDGEGGLTRTLVLSGRKPYDFTIDVQDYVPGNAGERVEVDITIPSGISEARFPLRFFIESYDYTIYPDATSAGNPTLPVASGMSKIPGKDSRSYWFTRTITYDEYMAAHEDIQSNKTFPSYFKTLVPASATTVYVQCDPETSNYFTGVENDDFVNERSAGEIHFEKDPLYVAVGSKATNPVTVNSGAPVTYSIQNTAVATINASTGQVIGVSEGETIVTATIPQYKAYTAATATFTVKVAELLPEWHFGWDRLLTPVVNVGKSVTTNTATSTVSTGAQGSNYHPEVTYSSSDPSTATVNAATGEVTGVNPGKVTITAHSEIEEYEENGHTYSAVSENIRYEIEVVAIGVSPAIGTEYVNVPFYDGKMLWFTKTHEGYDAWDFRSDDVRYGMQASSWDYSSNSSRDSNSWLISPEMDLRAAINPVLEFNHTGNYWTDGYTVIKRRDTLRTEGGVVRDSISMISVQYIKSTGEYVNTTQRVRNTEGEDIESITTYSILYVPALSERNGNLEQAKTRMMQDALVKVRFNGGAWSEGTLLAEEEYPTGYNWVSVNVSHPIKTLLAGKSEDQLKKVQFAFEYKSSPETMPADTTQYRPWGGTWQIKSFKVVEAYNE